MPIFGTVSRDAGKPDQPILATLKERPGQCTCTWVIYQWIPNGESVFSLRWHNTDCPVPRERHNTFHAGKARQSS